MDIKDLKQKYPEIRFSKTPIKQEQGELVFFEAPFYFAIPEKQLTEAEKSLLMLLFKEAAPESKSKAGKIWYQLLFTAEDVTIKDSSAQYRFIQYYLPKAAPSKTVFQDWKKALLGFFHSDTELIQLSPQYGVLVEPVSDSLLGDEELEAVANTLETDFYFPVRFFMGLFYQRSVKMRRFFSEERRFFDFQSAKPVQTVASGMIHDLAEHWRENPLAELVSQSFQNDDTLLDLIEALFLHQGNISMTAKELFMHRNTVQYRLDKYYEQTNLSLKTADGLLMAYLSLKGRQ
ncbi:PucR family transcriptional regulator [Listeria ilorinensis]|uniref:PucR family transcriptional regulator n=1 Tax=Listeria ilorinensis TaxID=2867439 RepID=UPI001EF46AE0|nr:helix-turn-helix domain-containing protein [Listeria ilorinensis]